MKFFKLNGKSSRKNQKIGYLSALTIIVGSTIGAGIFFRNGNIAQNNNGNLTLIIISWIIAAFGTLLLGLALIEVASASKNNKGFLAWIANFNSQLFSRYATTYMLFISIPLQNLSLPLFFVQTLQDAGGFQLNGWISAAIAFIVFLWLGIMTFVSLKMGERFSWALTSIKYIPLIAAPIIALVTSSNGVFGDAGPLAERNPLEGFNSLLPGLGLLASIPAILFTYDGFFSIAPLRSNLKKPKSIGPLMAIGIAILTASYLFVTIGFALGTTNGRVSGIRGITTGGRIAINAFVALSVFGLINNLILSTPQIYNTTILEKRVYSIHWLAMKINKHDTKLAGFLIFMFIVTAYYIILVPTGLYALSAFPGDQATYGVLSANLYQIADLLTGFSSLLIFAIISASIFGAIKNRFRPTVEVVKSKFFLWVAFPAVFFIWLAVGYFTISAIGDIVLLTGPDQVNAIIRFSIFLSQLAIPLVLIILGQTSKNYAAFVKSAPKVLIEA